MKSTKALFYKGKEERMTPEITIIRGLPNQHFSSIGSIVLLDHIAEKTFLPKTPKMPDGSFAHPHRGIATLTYILDGGIHHLDSNGGEGKVYSGGLQWMKSGNGIVHDEFHPYDFQEKGGLFSGFQFWLNLPAKQKAERPEYIAVQSENINEFVLADNVGVLRLLLGNYQDKTAIIPAYLAQFMYHIKLNPGKAMELPMNENWEYGINAIKGNPKIDNDIILDEKKTAKLYDFSEVMEISNESNETIEFVLFGGEPYLEQMVSYGPFIMNTQEGIAKAYSDYNNGHYNEIDYSKVQL
ncbi:MAG: redox-sensitive bicupin YhaK (pirin superfamily) [Planctomycetota bacterium]|jgi:redox-sensitive bicupin YhaK (pirin superfamily)